MNSEAPNYSPHAQDKHAVTAHVNTAESQVFRELMTQEKNTLAQHRVPLQSGKTSRENITL